MKNWIKAFLIVVLIITTICLLTIFAPAVMAGILVTLILCSVTLVVKILLDYYGRKDD